MLRMVRRRPLMHSQRSFLELRLRDGRKDPPARWLLRLLSGKTEVLHLTVRQGLLRQVIKPAPRSQNVVLLLAETTLAGSSRAPQEAGGTCLELGASTVGQWKLERWHEVLADCLFRRLCLLVFFAFFLDRLLVIKSVDHGRADR